MVNIIEVPIENAATPITGACFIDHYWYVVGDSILALHNSSGILFGMNSDDKEILDDLFYHTLKDENYDYRIKKLPAVYQNACQQYMDVVFKLKD